MFGFCIQTGIQDYEWKESITHIAELDVQRMINRSYLSEVLLVPFLKCLTSDDPQHLQASNTAHISTHLIP